MKNLLLSIIVALGLSACRCGVWHCYDYECTYTEEVNGVDTTKVATCSLCNEKDIKELEDAGWECE